MPPIRNKNKKNSAEQEGRILLAVSDLKNGKIRSVRQAAEIYNVSRSTLQNRVNGMAYRAEKRANNHKLTQFQEESLVKWVLDLNRRGFPPRHSYIRDMANYLLSQHGDQRVGDNWVYNLIQRRPEIDSKLSRRYNNERAKCEDPKITTPPPSRSSNIASSCLQTPQNIRQFIRQSTTIKKRISERTGSPNQVIDQAIMRMSKAYETTMNDLLLVRKENYNLRAAHEKEKQKRKRSNKQIYIEQGITRAEAQALVQGQVEASHTVTTTPAEPELPAPQAVVRRQYRCSGCNVMGHRINQCPNRTSS